MTPGSCQTSRRASGPTLRGRRSRCSGSSPCWGRFHCCCCCTESAEGLLRTDAVLREDGEDGAWGTEPLETASQRPHVLATRAPAAAWEAGAERSASSVLSRSEFVSSSGRRPCSPPGTLPRLWDFLFFIPRAFS